MATGASTILLDNRRCSRQLQESDQQLIDEVLTFQEYLIREGVISEETTYQEYQRGEGLVASDRRITRKASKKLRKR